MAHAGLTDQAVDLAIAGEVADIGIDWDTPAVPGSRVPLELSHVRC